MYRHYLTRDDLRMVDKLAYITSTTPKGVVPEIDRDQLEVFGAVLLAHLYDEEMRPQDSPVTFDHGTQDANIAFCASLRLLRKIFPKEDMPLLIPY